MIHCSDIGSYGAISVLVKVLGRQRLHPGIDAGIVFLEARTLFHASFHLILPQCLCKWGLVTIKG